MNRFDIEGFSKTLGTYLTRETQAFTDTQPASSQIKTVRVLEGVTIFPLGVTSRPITVNIDFSPDIAFVETPLNITARKP